MPCLFFRNVPNDFAFDKASVVKLHKDLADADGAEMGSFEVHIENTGYDLLLPSGLTVPAENVHVFVEAHARSLDVKLLIVEAIHIFLLENGLGKDSDITFRDSPSQTFFVNSVMVAGGPIRR